MVKKVSDQEIAAVVLELADLGYSAVPDDSGLFQVAKSIGSTYLDEGDRIEIMRVLTLPDIRLPRFLAALKADQAAMKGMN